MANYLIREDKKNPDRKGNGVNNVRGEEDDEEAEGGHANI